MAELWTVIIPQGLLLTLPNSCLVKARSLWHPRVRFNSVVSVSHFLKVHIKLAKKKWKKWLKIKRKRYFQNKKKITFALPHLTSVPMKAMLLLDARSPLVAASWGAVNLEQGVVSPVKLDSSMERSTDLGNIKHSITFKDEDSWCYI